VGSQVPIVERRQHPRYSVKLPLDRNVPRRPRLVGGVEGHNIKRDHLAGKPRPVGGELHFLQTPDVVLGGVVTDMSEAGLGFRSTHEIQISTDLGIRVYLSRGQFSFDSIEGTGRIIWRTAHQEEGWKGYRYGIYILKMASYSRDRLLKYIKMLEEEKNSSH
jgi:hypothetical protein